MLNAENTLCAVQFLFVPAKEITVSHCHLIQFKDNDVILKIAVKEKYRYTRFVILFS